MCSSDLEGRSGGWGLVGGVFGKVGRRHLAGGNWLLLVVRIGLVGGTGRNSGVFCSGRMLERT